MMTLVNLNIIEKPYNLVSLKKTPFRVVKKFILKLIDTFFWRVGLNVQVGLQVGHSRPI